MKVLLINTNREVSPYPAIPIGLSYVASSIAAGGFNTRVLDLCFSKDSESDILKTVRDFKPDVIGISIRNIDNGEDMDLRYSMPGVRKVIACCRKESPSIPIIIGGSAVNVMPEDILKYLEADIAVIGDGELTTPMVLERIMEKKGYSDINGIVFREDGAIRFNPPIRLLDYGFRIGCDILKWVDVQRYVSSGGIIPVQTKRGCTCECIYCSYPKIEGNHIRLKPPELVVDEIERIVRNSRVRDFEFVDSVFNLPLSHAKGICEEIIRRNIKVNLGAAGLNPIGCDGELFSLMKKANFRWLIFTAESGSEKMLSNLGKGFGTMELERYACLARRFEILTLWSFLIGGPGEDMGTVSETLEFIEKYVKIPDLAYVTTGVRLYPDTKLAKIAMDEGIINSQDELIEPKFYFSKDISKVELRIKLYEFSKAHPNFIHSYETRNPFFGLASRIFYIMRIPHPYWRYAWLLNKIGIFAFQRHLLCERARCPEPKAKDERAQKLSKVCHAGANKRPMKGKYAYSSHSIPLINGSRIAVIGAGPAGTLFTRFLLENARQKGIKVNLTIFDGKRFTVTGPRGCNMCAGVISENLADRLNEIGISFPDEIVQSRIQGYKLKTMMGELSLYNKNKEAKILTVFRGNGPDYSSCLHNVSFDNFLLDYVKGLGVELIQEPVSDITLPSGSENGVRIEYGRDKDKKTFIADGVVVACGLNTPFLEKIKKAGFGYVPPKVVNTCQMEITLPPDYIKRHFSDMIFVYSLGIPGIRFAAIVPKSEHLTVTVVGNKNMKKTDVWTFLSHPLVKKDMPDDWEIPERYCHCHPKIGLTPSKNGWTDRLVIIGDASWSRYYKNALESAFWTARFAAKSIIEHGWSGMSFKNYYYKRCKEKIIRDNFYGRLLFAIDRYITSLGFVTRAHITVANRADTNKQVKSLRWIIWNILTGNVPYKNILKAALNPLLQITLTWQILKDMITQYVLRKGVKENEKRAVVSHKGYGQSPRLLLTTKKPIVGIIGGGPAGCSCAITAKMLAERNNLDLKVLLYEKRYIKNEKKTCAGVLSPPLKKILKQLNIEIPEDMVHRIITDYVLHGKHENIHLTRGELEEEPTFSVQRNRFDDFLFKKARDRGVTVIEEEVTDINILPSEILLHSPNATRRCDVVVGAFGLNENMLNLFEKKLKTYKRPDVMRSILIELPMDEEIINHKFSNTIHAFLPKRMGRIEFAAITPKKDSLTMNVAGSRVTEKDMDIFLKSPELTNLIPITSVPSKQFYGVFPAGLAKNFYSDRVILIGDASGMVRPYKGKGINSALTTGIWAAEIILDKGLSKRDFKEFYERCAPLVEDCYYGRILRSCCRLASRFGWIDPVIAYANTDFQLYDGIYNIVSGNKSYRETVRDLISWRLIMKLAKIIGKKYALR